MFFKKGRGHMDKHQFDECFTRKYFEKQFKPIMLQRVFTLPDFTLSDTDLGRSNRNPVVRAPFDITLKTMEDCCSKYHEKGNIKGLVVFGYSLDEHLKFLKYPEDVLESCLYNKTSSDFQETVTVYNPTKKLIFLIRRAKDKKNLEHEMKSLIEDALKIVFLYNNILKNSGIKLINLLATDADVDCYQWKCKYCKHQVISMNSLDSSDSFENWLEGKECHFESDYDPPNNNNAFSIGFTAKLLGFLASFQFLKENNLHWSLPSLTENPDTQMEETTLLLTLEQLRIVNSPNKHLLTKGCCGSGKSLVAVKKARMTLQILQESEILYFVSYDSSSMLTQDMKSTSKMKFYHNTNALKLNIIKYIKEYYPEKKVNLFVDEYDTEQLDEFEAKRLDKIFISDTKFCDSIVCLVFEALEKERKVNDTKTETNLLRLLTSMKLMKLTYNKRNT